MTRKNNPITTPTIESTVSHDFTYAGWDSELVAAFANQTYTATYTSKLREYLVRYLSKGNVKQSTTAPYGSYVEYLSKEIPTYTAEESAYKYHLFSHWDKSGYVDGNKDVQAVYDTCEYSQDYFKGKDLSSLRPVEIYAMIQLGLESQYTNIKDNISIQFGSDYDYSDIEQKVLISEQTNFNGTNYIDTETSLFDTDRDFTLAIDYKFDTTSPQSSVLLQCFQNDGVNGFKVWNNSGSKFLWGTSSSSFGALGNRDMMVIRHVKGENGIHVYHSNLTGEQSTYVELTKNRATSTNATIVFGCSKADDGAYEDYAIGSVYWSKLWYADLGDNAAKNLVSWTHETIDMELCGFKKFYLSSNSSRRASMTLLAKNLLTQKKSLSNASNNTGGYASCTLPSWLNNRVHKGMNVQWRQLIKQVKVNSSIGNQSTDISSSDNYIYIPSVYELDSSMNSEPYVYEGTPIPYMSTNDARIRKYPNGEIGTYWTRSPNSQYTGYFYRMENNGQLSGYYYPYNSEGILIMFSI